MPRFNKLIPFIVLLCLSFRSTAIASSLLIDSLSAFVKSNDKTNRSEKVADFVKDYVETLDRTKTDQVKYKITNWLAKSDIQNKFALIFFTESICEKHIFHLANAQALMLKAIESVSKTDNHPLLYIFLKNLAFIQTDVGDAIGAISSYRLAKREAINLADTRLQSIINLDISDIYFQYDFFYQALSYLNDAERIQKTYRPNDERLKGLIYNYKCDVFFKMNKLDSVRKYSVLLQKLRINNREHYTQLKRNDYYLCLLSGNSDRAISLIKNAQRDSLYEFFNGDKQNLANAFFKTGQNDSAAYVINQLLADTLEVNHPELKYRQYEMLAQIAKSKGDNEQATLYFQNALHQSVENINRLIQVGNILSQIKTDEIEGTYIQRNEEYKKERIWLAFAVIVAILIIIIVAMFYRTAKQKRHYEKLLFTAQKEELAFINSHEVRRHLSNILGIIDVLEHSEDKEMEYNELEEHLFASAENLDKAIKSFSEKLTD